MKGRIKVLRQIKYIIIAFLVTLVCIYTNVYATDVGLKTAENTDSTNTNLPHLEMKVKAINVGASKQILVECWASKFQHLEGAEIVFTYDNRKLTPSNITNNEAIDLDDVKYEKRPTELEEQEEFDKNSTSLISNSFAFENEYSSILGIDLFRYLAPDNNNETLQFVISKKDYLQDISSIDSILLGKFSFKQTEGIEIEENEFATKRIKIICDDSLNGDELSIYMREEAKGEDCTEIVEFTYEKYGNISGAIETGYHNATGFETVGKNIATIKLYNASDVSDFEWDSVGNTYKTKRLEIQPIIEGEYNLCYRPNKNETPKIEPVMEITTTEEDLGSFKLEKVLFGEYVIVIDKLNYADYIITDVVVDATNKEIDLGNIQLEAGDLNKDGKIDKTDRTIFLKLYTNAKTFEEEFGMVAFDLNDDENAGKSSEKVDRTYMLKILTYSLNKTVKKVESLAE